MSGVSAGECGGRTVGLAVELGCLELLALLDVHASVHPGLGDYEVTGGLSSAMFSLM